MSKLLTYTCDLCGEKIQGGFSIYISNDMVINAQMERMPVQKEEHFCDKNCTEKIKIAILKKDGI